MDTNSSDSASNRSLQEQVRNIEETYDIYPTTLKSHCYFVITL